LAAADDGQKVLKQMTGGSIDNQLEVLPEDIGIPASYVEHAFTNHMTFYVPMQSASGATGDALVNDADDYYNIDDVLVETLEVAKPLVNVFIYGPAIEPPNTAFLHSFMDTFAAVSLDDGVTWKTTNLSQTAALSSFTLGEDTQVSDGGTSSDEDDGDHEGQTHVLVLETAEWSAAALPNWGKLDVSGLAEPRDLVGIINYTVSGDVLFQTLASQVDGTFEREAFVRVEDAPCMVQAVVNDVDDGMVYSNPLAVEYGEETPVDCHGVDLTEYPGGAFNVIHSTVGNKTLVAWPSRFCQQGQPTYSYAWDGDDEGLSEEQLAKRDALVSLLGISLDSDLYLTDLFGVAGSQRSIDFATEGYPQAGEVPFGCVWTARGILLPGDDPRTDEVEESYTVWTKPERLTSGRRDPNRIEVAGVSGAGFVVTWQEDPDGLRPGQGEGPGEGWSGAVAHDKTDIWYSFIPWQYFDLLENPDDPAGEPIDAPEFDLLLTGRPQVYVPMAIPMRLSNNDKCQADLYGPEATHDGIWDPTDPKYFSYCNYEVAEAYGLQDFCADTVSIPQGQTGELGDICVNEDGLPNVANTASTRPRTSLQPHDSDGDGSADTAWVIIAAEESKGLGRYTFLPDGTPCVELPKDDPAYNPDCLADIGKNQWYYTFNMGEPQTSLTSADENGLVQNLVSQGNMLNQPEVDWRTGEFYPVINTEEMWDFGDYNFDLYNTEIARRSSLLVQSYEKACYSGGGLVAISSYKQGAMRQGGPADVMLRRFIAPCEEQGVCDSDIPGPGPGGVQPTIELAEWTTNCYTTVDGVDVCELVVEGTVCVDGYRDPTDIVLQIEDPATGEALCVAKVNEDYTFTTQYELPSGLTASCDVPVEEQPCTVIAVTGPGMTQGDGQASDPETVVDESGEPVCEETACPIDDNVDAEQPVVESAKIIRGQVGAIYLQVTVSGFDGYVATPIQLRNAVTEAQYGNPRSFLNEGQVSSLTYNISTALWPNVPCAIQAADWDGSPAYGPWIQVDTSAVPSLECTGPIPPECTD